MTYPERLHAAWLQHLAPRSENAPTLVSTFAGCGGSSLGYSMAGFRELLAVEWDDYAVQAFSANFHDVPVHHGDIADVDPAGLGLVRGELDVLDGSPPCQGFSTNGNRRQGDPRNQLFREFVRLLDAWNPRAFVMENVHGLALGAMRPTFVQVVEALRAAGDGYVVACRLLNAKHLGVPQNRPRLIFIGLRADLGAEPVHPVPEPYGPVLRDAIGDLADAPGLVPTWDDFKMSPRMRNLFALMPPGKCGKQMLVPNGKAPEHYSKWRAQWDQPCHTLLSAVRQGDHTTAHLHPDRSRVLGLREVARVQSFPDEYVWPMIGNPLKDYQRIAGCLGNSVPPLMMRAVALVLAQQLDALPAPDALWALSS